MSQPSSIKNIKRRRRRKKFYAKLRKGLNLTKGMDKKSARAKLLKIAPFRSIEELEKK